MELVIIIFLVVIALVVIRASSEISYIRFQNESLRKDLQELRRSIGYYGEGLSDEAPVMSGTPVTDETSEEETFTGEEDTATVMPPEAPPTQPETATENYQADMYGAEDEKIAEEDPPGIRAEMAPKPNNWEKFIGVNLFSKIGILILIVGIGFFVKYAIDRDWINEATRTALGIGVGLSLWGIAYRIRDQYRNFSSILAGGGFAICLVCIAVAFHFYGMFSATVTFVSLIALTAVMTVISMRFDRPELAIVSIIGGFTAPFIASDGSGSFLFVLGYMAVLNTAMFAATLYKNWWTLPIVSCFLTYIICTGGWLSGNLKDDSSLKFMTVTYYFILFSIPLVTVFRRNASRSGITGWLMSALVLNSLGYLTIGDYLAASSFLPLFHGLPGLIGATVNFGIYLRYYMSNDNGPAGNLLLTLIAGFALAAFLMQFTNPGIYISAIGIEAAVMSWLYVRTGRRIFRNLALAIGLPFTMILLLLFFCSGSDWPNLRRAWGYIVTGIAYMWSAYLAFENREKESILSTGALWAGGILGAAGGYIVLSHYLTAPLADGCTLLLIAAMMLAVVILTAGYRLISTNLILPGLAALIFALMSDGADKGFFVNIPLMLSMGVFAAMYLRSGKDVFRSEPGIIRHRSYYMVYFNIAVTIFTATVVIRLLDIAGLPHLHSAGLSVALTLCAAAQMTLGMRHHNKLLRIISLCVFGIVIAKLAAYDLWRMAAVGRIIVFILLGVILLAVSFLYQRLRGVLLDDDRESSEEEG